MTNKNNTVYFARYSAEDIGPIGIAVTSRGLCSIALRSSKFPEALGRLVAKRGWKRVASLEKTAPYFEQIRAYLLGQRREFRLSIDWDCIASPFQKKVLKALRQVPFGEVISYGDLAKRIGQPGAARAVGTALAHNPIPLVLPCHRVVRRDGSLGGFSGGLDIKERLLTLEGVRLKK